MTAAWLPSSLLAFDVESTGVDTSTDRIVTAAAVELGLRGKTNECNWLINPGVEIPAGAYAVHGISTEYARENGQTPMGALENIADTLRRGWANGLPLVAFNARYDLSMLAAELERYALPALTIGPVLDPFVIDSAVDRYRKGKRTLTAVAAHYGVKQDEAHTSLGDALTAARIVWKMGQTLPGLARVTLEDMHGLQARAYAEKQASCARFKGLPVGDLEWPTRKPA